MLRGCTTSQRASGLDMARGSLETSGAFVEMTVDADVAEFPALETGLMVAGVIIGERYVMVAAGPPDFGASEGDFFFLGQRRQ